MRTHITRLFFTTLLSITCLIIPGHLSLGEMNPNNSTTDCNLTPDPATCFWQQSQIQWQQSSIQNLPLNTQAMGLSGPFSATITYDNDLAWILGLSYVEMLNERFGLAMKASLGPNEWRGNLTAGYAFNDRHQAKLTYEYLTQNLPYDFASGTVNSWVSQHALGGAYQYLLQQGVVHSLELSGSYAKAQGKNLSDVIFYQGDDAYLNKRRIAPGQESTGMAKINLLPSGKTALSLGGGYSQVQYDTRYENNQNNATFAYATELEHIFHPTLKLSTAVNNTASNTNYNAKVSKLLPKNFEISLSGQYQNGRGNLGNASNVMLGLTYPAPKSYTVNKFSTGLAELKSWIEKPVVYYTRVLAVKDELVQKYTLTSQPIPSQTKSIAQTIDEVDTKNYFQFDPKLYDQVQYTMVITPSGKTGQDYASQLRIVLTQVNPYEATISSAQPIPGGQNLEGNYNITITANGMKKGLRQPITETRTFGLTVLYAGPTWTDKNLPDATAGVHYPDINLSENSGTNNGYVLTNDLPQDQYTFSIIDGPSWLTIQDQHILTSAGPAPTAATNTVSLKLSVTSQTLHQTADKVFQIQIKAGAPVWNGTLPDGQYDAVYPSVNLKDLVTTPGTSADNYTFTLDGAPSWLQLSPDGQSLIGNGPIPENQGNEVTFSITAVSAASEISTPQVFTFHIKPGNPKWTENMLPDGQYGQTYEAVDLSALLYTPGLMNDTYRITLGDNTPPWLTINDDHILVGTAPVPDTQTSPITITVQAVSKQTGLSAAPQVFTLVITNPGAPIWIKTQLPDAQYGAVYTSTDLDTYVSTPGLTETYSYTLKDLPTWLKLTDGHTLQGVGNIPDSAPDVVQIHATVTGATSKKSTDEVLSIRVRPGAPVWSGTLPPAQYLQAYPGVDLLPLVQTPGVQGDNYEFKIDAAPSWLTLGVDGHSLVAAGPVPENVSSPVTIRLTAISQTSQLSNSQDFSITINPGAPVWVDYDLPNAQVGSTYETVDLVPMVHTPGLANDTFQMELEPGAPDWLKIAADGHSLTGVAPVPANQPTPIQISVKATSGSTGLNTVQKFTLNITPAGAPMWIRTELPDGQYAAPYTPVDLTTYVDTPNRTGETYEFKITQAPSWLIIASDGHTLQATGPIPEDSPNVVQVYLSVTGTQSQLTTPGVLSLRLKPGAPIWNGQLPAAQYNVDYVGTDLLPLVHTPGEVSDNYTFTLDAAAPGWLQLGSDGHSLISNGIVPDNEASPVTVKITAKSAASGLSTTEEFSITINPGVPVWTNNTLPNAQYGSTYGDVDLSTMLYTPGLPNDTYTMELAPGTPTWLKIVDGHTLTGVEPTPDSEQTPLQITIKATSKTGLSKDQTFDLVITPRSAPIWTNTELPDGTYDAVCDPVDLNTYVTTPGQSDSYSFTLTKTPPWLDLDKDGHTLICTQAIPDDADSIQSVEITVTGVNSKLSTPGTLAMHIQPGAPVWNGTLPDAQYNSEYGSVDLLPLVRTPGETSDNYTFTLENNAPSWLKLNGNSLVANGPVPETETSPVSVNISATSSASKKTTAQIFQVNIQPGYPIWTGDLPSGQYDAPYPSIDLSTMVRTPGLANDNYEMKLSSDAPPWLAIDPNDHHTLIGTAPIPDNAPTPVTVTIEAISQGTSNKLSTSQTFTFSLLKGLAWSNATPIAATAGDTNYKYDLNELITCPVNEQCFLQVSNLPSWLTVEQNADGTLSLINTKPVPAATEDTDGSVSFDVSANSSSNQTLPIKTFNIPITNVLPEWQQNSIPSVYYDGSSTDGNDPDQTVHLNDYITTKTNSGLSFQPGPNFDSKVWRIDNPAGTQDYYLVKLPPGDINEINTQEKISILAKNNTSTNGSSHDVLVNIIPNGKLAPPTWNTTTLPSANMGTVYGDSNAIIDLNTMVSTQNVNNDSFQFTFDDKTLPHPTWLDGAEITKSGHLTSTGIVPIDGGVACSTGGTYDVCFNVAILATSKASGHSQSYTFKDVPIAQTLPSWSKTPPVAYDKWSIAYDDTKKGIELGQFIEGGKNNLTFALAQPKTNWQIVLENGSYYLRRTTGSDPLPTDINTTADLRIIARNNTSTPANQNANAYQDVKVSVTADSDIKPPEWKSNISVPDADMGYNYPKTGTVNLGQMVTTSGVSNDTYTFTFDDSDSSIGPHPSWLIISNGQLINDPSVNKNEVPKTAVSPFAIKIIATSTASGNSTPFTFSNIKVNQIPPVWQGVQASQIQFDDLTTSIPPSGTTLKNWIQTGTDKNVVFSFNTSGKSTCSTTDFIAANWAFGSSSPANIFRSTTGKTNIDDIWDSTDATIVNMPVMASNDTSTASVEACLPVKVTADATLQPPTWTSTTLPSAAMGAKYGDSNAVIDLNTMVATSGVNDSFQFTFDDKTLPHPTWLDSAEITKSGHLTSTGIVPIDGGVACSTGGTYDVCFNVAILATSKASGHSQSYTFKDVPIAQTLPSWSKTPPVAYDKWSIAYDDTKKGIELGQFIDGGKNNLTFALAQPKTNWQIVLENGSYYLRRTTGSDPLPTDINTTADLRIVARNNTSTPANQNANAYQDVKVSVTADSDIKPPEWKSNISVPDADMGYNYPKTGTVNLGQMVTTSGVSNDTYTFTFDDSDSSIGPHPSWLIISNGQLINDPSINKNEVPKTAVSPFAIKIIAKSTASGNSTPFTFSNIKVNQIPPVWQGVQASQIQFDDLTTSIPPSGTTLKNWIQTGTDKNVIFSFNASGKSSCNLTNYISSNWVFSSGSSTNIVRSPAGKTNAVDVWDGTNDTLAYLPVLASNDTSAAPVETCLQVKVLPDTSIPAPTWLNKNFPPIYGGKSASGPYTYQVDLSNYISDSSNTAFSCKIDSKDVAWLIINTQNTGQLINDPSVNNGGVPVLDDKPQIAINCQSKASAQWTGSKTFTIDVAPVMKLADDPTLPSQIKFDDIDNGLNAYDFLMSGRKGITLSIAGVDASYMPNNWTVANSQYLRRKPVNTNQIDAQDLTGSIQGKVKINVKVGNSTSTIQATQDMALTLLPDPNLSFRYDGQIKSPMAVADPPVDPKTNVYQTVAIVDTSNTRGFYMRDPNTPFQVINDTNFSYTNPGGQPDYIEYDAPPKIGIGYPTVADFEKKVSWGVNIKTTANGGGSSGNGVYVNMPLLSFYDVILVPPANPSTSGVMVLGQNYWATGGTKWFYTYLQLQLSPNTKYVVDYANNVSKGNNANWKQICPGRETRPPSSTTCTNGPQLATLADGARFTTDSTGIVTFVLSAVYNAPTGEYPVFLYGSPNSEADNIRLSSD